MVNLLEEGNIWLSGCIFSEINFELKIYLSLLKYISGLIIEVCIFFG